MFVTWISNDNRLMRFQLLFGNWISYENRLMDPNLHFVNWISNDNLYMGSQPPFFIGYPVNGMLISFLLIEYLTTTG